MMVVLKGGRVKAARLAAGLTLRAAAVALGVSKTTLVNTETGTSKPGSELLGRMAQLYHVEISSLFDGASVESEAPAAVAQPVDGPADVGEAA
jgi:transcriptional regulator with XRE-family HTH domain